MTHLPVMIILLLKETPLNPKMGPVGRLPTWVHTSEPEMRISVDARCVLEPERPPVTR